MESVDTLRDINFSNFADSASRLPRKQGFRESQTRLRKAEQNRPPSTFTCVRLMSSGNELPFRVCDTNAEFTLRPLQSGIPRVSRDCRFSAFTFFTKLCGPVSVDPDFQNEIAAVLRRNRLQSDLISSVHARLDPGGTVNAEFGCANKQPRKIGPVCRL